MLIDIEYMTQLRARVLDRAAKRRNLIKHSGDALHLAKRAIFSIHRDVNHEAQLRLDAAQDHLLTLESMIDECPSLSDEGSYRAAVEEFVEAYSLIQFVRCEAIRTIPIRVSDEAYLAGMADVVGELYRLSIRAATNNDHDTVIRARQAAEEIIGELIECELTSYLRTKFDQAKGALAKIEHVVYDLSLRS